MTDRERLAEVEGRSFDVRHALAVASHFAVEDDAWLTGLLHDVIEDGQAISLHLSLAGVPGPVIQAVVMLTRADSESYDDYIARLASLPPRHIARRVKIADLRANLARMDPAHESLRPRYEKALEVLADSGLSCGGAEMKQIGVATPVRRLV